ncbi:SseB family protein [Rhodobacterales bacterium HKCCE2091]|nr:SseB family protein [Rhodobacterales bacterium HKCCE2091]
MTETPLDRAFIGLDPEDETARRAAYSQLAAAELFLLLDGEPDGGAVDPRLFPLESGPVVLAFDTEARLADFAGSADYAGLTGRALAAMLAGRGIGLGLNIGAASETVLGPDVFDWLAEQAVGSMPAAGKPDEILPPGDGIPDAVLAALESRLAAAAGLARRAVLARARYSEEVRPILALLDPAPEAESALAAAIGEALAIAGADPSGIDLAFLASDHPAALRLLSAGLAIDLPEPPSRTVSAPGLDPDRPPRLR